MASRKKKREREREKRKKTVNTTCIKQIAVAWRMFVATGLSYLSAISFKIMQRQINSMIK